MTKRGFRWRGGVAAVVLPPLAITALISMPFVQEDSLLDWAVDAVAFTLYLAGLTFRFWATLYVGGRKVRVVVAEGPYSVCRNPLYLGSFLLAAVLGLCIKNWPFAVGILAVSIFYILATVPAEEEQIEGNARGGIRSGLPPSAPFHPASLPLSYASGNHCEH